MAGDHVTGSVRRSAACTRPAALFNDRANRRCARATDVASLRQSLKFGISIRSCSMRARCLRDLVIKYNWKSGHFLSSSSISSRFAIARSNGVSGVIVDPNTDFVLSRATSSSTSKRPSNARTKRNVPNLIDQTDIFAFSRLNPLSRICANHGASAPLAPAWVAAMIGGLGVVMVGGCVYSPRERCGSGSSRWVEQPHEAQCFSRVGWVEP